MENTPVTPITPPKATSRFETGVKLTKLAGIFMAAHLILVVIMDQTADYPRRESMPTEYLLPMILGAGSTLLSIAAIVLAIVGVNYFAFDKRPLDAATIARHNQRKLVWGILCIISPIVLGFIYFIVAIGAFVSSSTFILYNPVTSAIAALLSSLTGVLFIPGIVCGIMLLSSRRKVIPHATN